MKTQFTNNHNSSEVIEVDDVTFEDGSSYTGDWKKNCGPHGYGTETYHNGDTFSGEFIDGRPVRGTMWSEENRTNREGEFVDGEWVEEEMEDEEVLRLEEANLHEEILRLNELVQDHVDGCVAFIDDLQGKLQEQIDALEGDDTSSEGVSSDDLDALKDWMYRLGNAYQMAKESQSLVLPPDEMS